MCHWQDVLKMYTNILMITIYFYLIFSSGIVHLTWAGYETKEGCEKLTRRSKCKCFHGYIKCGPITLNTLVVLDQIRCSSTNAKDYELLPNLNINNLTTLTFINCPVPDKYTINDAIQRLGIKKLDNLILQNGFDVTDTRIELTQQHYQDTKGFKNLQLFRFRSVLPEDYFVDCTQLQELTLFGYSALPANVLNPLEHLERLKIVIPNIEQISGELLSMQQYLKELDMSCWTAETNKEHTALSGVMFSQNTELRKLWIKYCGDGLPRQLFKHSTQLESLSIRSDLKSLDKDLFSKLNNLLELKLAYNKLESLPLDIFKYNQKLRLLYLAHNQFSHIPSKLFDHLKYLQVLNLEDNPLKSIDANAFQQLRGKIFIKHLYDKVLSGELKLNTEATICKLELIKGVCRFCTREEYLKNYDNEQCKNFGI